MSRKKVNTVFEIEIHFEPKDEATPKDWTLVYVGSNDLKKAIKLAEDKLLEDGYTSIRTTYARETNFRDPVYDPSQGMWPQISDLEEIKEYRKVSYYQTYLNTLED